MSLGRAVRRWLRGAPGTMDADGWILGDLPPVELPAEPAPIPAGLPQPGCLEHAYDSSGLPAASPLAALQHAAEPSGALVSFTSVHSEPAAAWPCPNWDAEVAHIPHTWIGPDDTEYACPGWRPL